MKIALSVVVLVALLHGIQEVSANAAGAPMAACDTLTPNAAAHGAGPQTSAVPYSIDLSPLCSNGTYSYYPGQTYTLSLAGNDGEQFRGVFVQARLMAEDNTRVGTFAVHSSSAADTRLSLCTIMTDGITHQNGQDKNSVYFDWTAPANGTGTIRFGFAVVQVRNTYWADQRSMMIVEDGSGEAGLACVVPTNSAPEATTSGASQISGATFWTTLMFGLAVLIKKFLY